MYYGLFDSAECVAGSFGIDIAIVDSVNMIAAKYTYEDYQGSALVLFEKDGKFYRIHGGHCSCYGLDEQSYSGGGTQWEPEEIELEYLKSWVKNTPMEFEEMLGDVAAFIENWEAAH